MQRRSTRERSYSEFRQRIRRHRPSDLLPAIARISSSYSHPDDFLANRQFVPWALACAAKESLSSGTEFRPPGATDRDVSEICAMFGSLRDPTLAAGEDPLRRVFVRMLYEQFPYQQSMYEEIARTYALFSTPEQGLKVIGPGVWETLLGCSLVDFIGAAFLLAVGAQNNQGYFDSSWLSQDNFKLVLEEVNEAAIIATLTKHYATTEEEFKADCVQHASRSNEWRRYDFNPLKAKPFVLMPDGRYLAPVVNLVSQKISPETLFYAGIERFGKDFADDVGILLQEYVGGHLDLIPATLIREIEYNRGQARSVDWIVVFDDLVLLIEVKATRLTQEARMGRERLDLDIQRAVGKAFDQINRTETLLREDHPDFKSVPTDRPRLGLVVTLEPYWMANSPFVREILPDTLVPTMACSVRELEHFVALSLGGRGAAVLRDVLMDEEKRTWALGNALPPRRDERNPLLDAAWDRLPWKDRRAAR